MASLKRNTRRRGALERLKAQLASGVKNKKMDADSSVPVTLTASDIKRIEAEIKTLESRVGA